ncbi:hypothetical protein [Pseudomonas syringae]|uniref:hypothetical protein n=1 Tax=Pseudomonas syringae TaxID=317 RepID=UPI00046750B2|nr:hypothetical protein [Pseudomonas syringae]QGG78936.1 hypothetical protein N028_26800 [Pseudomonas syringae USA011]
MDTPQTFITQAIGAASAALTALASGQRLESDNLIAGALALELVMGRDDLAAYRFNGINVAIRGLRALAMRQAMAQTPGGKLAADSFAAMLDSALAQWGMQKNHQGDTP